MGTRTVHVAVYDTLADWEIGYLVARVNNPMWQRDPGSIVVRTVGAPAGQPHTGQSHTGQPHTGQPNLDGQSHSRDEQSSAGPAPVTTMGGIRILPDVTADTVDPASSEMLVLAGAELWESDAGIPWAAELARTYLAAGVPVAAICGATAGLARAGLLDDHRHTSSAAEYLQATGYAGAERYQEAPAVNDGGLITAGPTEPVAFARAALEQLGIYDPAVLNAWYLLFHDQDPSGFAALMAAAPA